MSDIYNTSIDDTDDMDDMDGDGNTGVFYNDDDFLNMLHEAADQSQEDEPDDGLTDKGLTDKESYVMYGGVIGKSDSPSSTEQTFRNLVNRRRMG
jgi:hypothetical protein